MAAELVPILLGGGAITYVAVSKPPAGPPNATTSSGSNMTTGGMGSMTVGDLMAGGGVRPVGRRLPLALRGLVRPAMGGSNFEPVQLGGTTGDPNQPPWSIVTQKLHRIEQLAKKAYDDLSDTARAEGADVLSKTLKLDPPLSGSTSWEDLSKIAGGAAGGAVGGAIGGPYGAYLGAIIGSYLGDKLENLMAKKLDELGDYAKKEWNVASEWVTKEAGALYDSAKGIADDAYNYVSSII
jgi:hypothetical protein